MLQLIPKPPENPKKHIRKIMRESSEKYNHNYDKLSDLGSHFGVWHFPAVARFVCEPFFETYAGFPPGPMLAFPGADLAQCSSLWEEAKQ